MKKIAVATDSNSGITQEQAAVLGLHVLPMPFTLDGASFFEGVNLTQALFYEKLAGNSEISTSQPALGAVLDLWDSLLKEYDEVVYIPMSSGLSASCQSALALSNEYEGRVFVVDNRRISVTQRQSALDAMTLAAAGHSGAEIRAQLEKNGAESSIYIMVDTLKYLKNGGRITAAAAAIGTILNLKPVLQIHGGKLDAYGKARGAAQAHAMMIDAMRRDFSDRFADCASPEAMHLQLAYTYDRAAAESFKEEVAAAFPGYPLHMDPLSLSVSCHIGPGALAIACSKKINA